MDLNNYVEPLVAGKRVGDRYYIALDTLIFHRDQTIIDADTADVIMHRLGHIRNPLCGDVVRYDRCTGVVSLVFVNSMRYAHPAIRCISTVTDFKDYQGRMSMPIYHRMDMIVGPTHPLWPFHRTIAKFEVEHDLLGRNNIGTEAAWEAFLRCREIHQEHYEIVKAAEVLLPPL